MVPVANCIQHCKACAEAHSDQLSRGRKQGDEGVVQRKVFDKRRRVGWADPAEKGMFERQHLPAGSQGCRKQHASFGEELIRS